MAKGRFLWLGGASPFFLSQRTGRWKGKWILLSWIAVIAGFAVAALILFGVGELISPGSVSEFMESEFCPTDPLGLILALLATGALFWTPAIFATLVQGRPIKSLVVPAQNFRWTVVYKALVLFVLVTTVVSVLIAAAKAIGLGPSNPAAISFEGIGAAHAIWLIPVLIATLVQTSGEDVLFKGLLLRQLGAVTRLFWVAPLLISASFTALHIGNPDLEQNLVLVLIPFVLSELSIIGLLMWTGGMEIPLVAHWVNNTYVTLFLAERGTQSNELTIFVSEQLGDVDAVSVDQWNLFWFAIFIVLIVAGIVWNRSPFYVARYTWQTPTELTP